MGASSSSSRREAPPRQSKRGGARRLQVPTGAAAASAHNTNDRNNRSSSGGPDVSPYQDVVNKIRTMVCWKSGAEGGGRSGSVVPAAAAAAAVDEEEEEICSTCLEGYDEGNPKIMTKCKHHYHLSCILEWEERSATCPICNRIMVYNEKSDTMQEKLVPTSKTQVVQQ